MGQEEVRGEPELWFTAAREATRTGGGGFISRRGSSLWLTARDDAGKVPLVGARRLRWSEKTSAAQSVTRVERGWM